MQSGRLNWRPAAIATFSLVLIGGCAVSGPTDSKTAEYRRADAALRAVDEFEAFKHACRSAGGVVYVDSNWGRARSRLPDLSTARCASPLSRHRR